MQTRPTFRTGALVAAGLLLIAACSNSSSDDAQPATAPPASEVAVTAASTPEPSNDTAPDTAATSIPDEAPADTTASTQPADTAVPIGEFAPISGVPGVTDTEIQFAVLGTGPANPLGTCLLECYLGGVQAYFDWRNSLGGVNGRQLTITHEVDDEVGATQVKMLEMIESDDVFGVFLAPLIYSGIQDAADAGMPVYTLAQGGPESGGFDNVFLPGLFCNGCPRKVHVHQAELVGATKVGTLAFSTSQASVDCATNTKEAFDLWGADVGIEHVYINTSLAFGLPNGIAPEVTAMAEAGVDYVTTCMDQNSVVSLEREMERQGLIDVPVLIPQGYADTDFVNTNAALLEGDPLGVFFRPFEADQDGTQVPEFLEWMEAGGHKINDAAIQGWINADMAVTGVLAAGPTFHRTTVIAATNEITDYTAGGMLPLTDWTKQHTVYTPESMLTDGPQFECIATLFVVGGAFELQGDPAKPYYCYDRSTLEWTDPIQMNT
jgi:Periplasmic binding protein